MTLTRCMNSVMYVRRLGWSLLVTIVTINPNYSASEPTGAWFGSHGSSNNNWRISEYPISVAIDRAVSPASFFA